MSDERTVQEQIGQMAATFMEFAEKQELSELVLGGIAIAGKTELGTNIVLTRTTARDPFACLKLWHSAADLEVDGARRDVRDRLMTEARRIHQLEDQIRMLGHEPLEPEA